MSAKAESAALVVRVAGRLAAAGVRPGDGAVAAVSGGGDSVALLRILVELRDPLDLRLTAAHLHHGLRGERADADQAFVRDLCGRLGVPLAEGRAEVAREARRDGVSLEMAGRLARRRFLDRVRAEAAARFLILAHHADDQAETLLLRLARGSGLVGAGAMAPQSADDVLRPLLEERRSTLRAYLEGLGQPWCEDETNAEPSTERNRLRLAVLPAWEVANPGVGARLARSAAHLRDDGELLTAAVEALMPPAVRDNGGPWRLIPWPLWSAATPPLRRQLLRQAAFAVAGAYPPAHWTEAWARWPETRETRPDLPWLRAARAPRAAVVFRPALPTAVPLPSGPGPWRLALPDGAALAAEPASAKARGAALGPALVARRGGEGERLRAAVGSATAVREVLRERGVPAPCRAGAWLVDDGRSGWLPAGVEARRRVARPDGGSFDLVWRAPPVHGRFGGWPAPSP